jgi:ABC-type dipeptide/oligopeptide/nickel transport system permease component
MNDVWKFVLRRIPMMLVSLWLLITAIFLLVALVPADPARAVAGPYATAADIAKVSRALGLNHSLWTRYIDYWKGLFHGSLGQSIYSNGTESVMGDIGKYLPATLELVILSLFVGSVLGLALGIVGAYFHRRWPDRASSALVSVFQALPDFLLGVLLIYVFAYLLKLLPGPEGQLSIIANPPPKVTGMYLVDSLLAGQMGTFWDALEHAVLPSLTLGIVLAAFFGRISRAALRDAFDSEQTSFARACGLPERTVIHYAVMSSRTPILTYAALLFAGLFGGTAIVETIFNWNGLSQWAVNAMLRQDYPEIQGFVLVVGVITLLVYFALDLATGVLDPRVRTVSRG